jgi:hypothetical protein
MKRIVSQIECILWRLIFRVTPGYLIRSNSAILNAVYLWIAAQAFAAEEWQERREELSIVCKERKEELGIICKAVRSGHDPRRWV